MNVGVPQKYHAMTSGIISYGFYLTSLESLNTLSLTVFQAPFSLPHLQSIFKYECLSNIQNIN